jgi:hypothetical protein
MRKWLIINLLNADTHDRVYLHGSTFETADTHDRVYLHGSTFETDTHDRVYLHGSTFETDTHDRVYLRGSTFETSQKKLSFCFWVLKNGSFIYLTLPSFK